jgi:hypothetical protein
MDRAGIRQQADDGPEHLLEVERGPDRLDDRVQDPTVAGMRGRSAYGRIVRGN